MIPGVSVGKSFPQLLARFCAPHRKEKLWRVAVSVIWLLFVLLIAFVITTVSVAMDTATPLTWSRVVATCLSSLASGLFGTIATVLSLEALRVRRAERAQRVEYLVRLGSSDRVAVSQTIEELRAKQLLSTGYLDGVHLAGANLSGMDLRQVRLVGANLDGADLSGAVLYDADLRFCSLRDIKVDDRTNLYLCKHDGAVFAGSDIAALKRSGLSLLS